jgi:hypothetical protein
MRTADPYEDILRGVRGARAGGSGKGANGHADEASIATYQLEGPDDFRRVKRPRFVVPGLIPEGGAFLLFSPSGHYKTTVALFVLVMSANGKALDGGEIEPTPLVIVANEDAHGVKVRLIALADHLGLSLANVRVLGADEKFRLDLEEDRDRLVASVRQAFPEVRPNLLVDHYDVSVTLNPSDPETGAVARDALRDLIARAFASAGLLAHTPWTTTDRAKLPVALWANMDARLRLNKKDDGSAELFVEHVKNAESGYTHTVTLGKVTVDLDDGPFDTVVAQFAMNAHGEIERGKKQKKRQKPSADQRTALNAIARAVIETPAPTPDGSDIPRGAAGTSEAAAVEMIARLVPRTTKSGKEREDWQQRAHAGRVLLSLHDRWLARVVDGFVWLPKEAAP